MHLFPKILYKQLFLIKWTSNGATENSQKISKTENINFLFPTYH